MQLLIFRLVLMKFDSLKLKLLVKQWHEIIFKMFSPNSQSAAFFVCQKKLDLDAKKKKFSFNVTTDCYLLYIWSPRNRSNYMSSHAYSWHVYQHFVFQNICFYHQKKKWKLLLLIFTTYTHFFLNLIIMLLGWPKATLIQYLDTFTYYVCVCIFMC